MSEKITIALIYGSTREGRFCDTIVNWAVAELAGQKTIEIVLVDPAKTGNADEAARVEAQLRAADAFIIATPEYNHGYPGPLKELIDSHYQPWHGKPAGFISYGGVSGGIRAVEQPRQVFVELHAMTVRESVSFAHVWSKFDASGNPFQPVEARIALLLMVRRLTWWARALKAARLAEPYDKAAA